MSRPNYNKRSIIKSLTKSMPGLRKNSVVTLCAQTYETVPYYFFRINEGLRLVGKQRKLSRWRKHAPDLVMRISWEIEDTG